MTNSPETNTDGRPTELTQLKDINKRMQSGEGSVTVSAPSTLLDDDVTSINDLPDRPSRPDEFPVARSAGPQDCTVVDTLGKSKKWWDKAKHELFAQYGDEITKNLKLPRVLVTTELSSYEYLERAMEQCVKLSENEALPAEDRMDAAEVVGYLAEISGRKAKILLEIADKAQKSSVEKPPRNLPPGSAIVQVNVAAGEAQVKEKHALPAAKAAPKHVTMGPQGAA